MAIILHLWWLLMMFEMAKSINNQFQSSPTCIINSRPRTNVRCDSIYQWINDYGRKLPYRNVLSWNDAEPIAKYEVTFENCCDTSWIKVQNKIDNLSIKLMWYLAKNSKLTELDQDDEFTTFQIDLKDWSKFVWENPWFYVLVVGHNQHYNTDVPDYCISGLYELDDFKTNLDVLEYENWNLIKIHHNFETITNGSKFYLISCVNVNYSYSFHNAKCHPRMIKNIGIRCQCLPGNFGRNLHHLAIIMISNIWFWSLVVFLFLAYVEYRKKRYKFFGQRPEFQFSFIMCSFKTMKYQYKLVLRVGCPSPTFDMENNMIDLELLGQNQEPMGNPIRFNCKRIPNKLQSDLRCFVGKVFPLERIYGIKIHHTGRNTDETIFIFDLQLFDFDSGKLVQKSTINRTINNIPTVIQLSNDLEKNKNKASNQSIKAIKPSVKPNLSKSFTLLSSLLKTDFDWEPSHGGWGPGEHPQFKHLIKLHRLELVIIISWTIFHCCSLTLFLHLFPNKLDNKKLKRCDSNQPSEPLLAELINLFIPMRLDNLYGSLMIMVVSIFISFYLSFRILSDLCLKIKRIRCYCNLTHDDDKSKKLDYCYYGFFATLILLSIFMTWYILHKSMILIERQMLFWIATFNGCTLVIFGYILSIPPEAKQS